MELTLTLLFLPYLMFRKFWWLYLQIFLESDHFSPAVLLTLWRGTPSSFSQLIAKALPAFFLASLPSILPKDTLKMEIKSYHFSKHCTASPFTQLMSLQWPEDHISSPFLLLSPLFLFRSLPLTLNHVGVLNVSGALMSWTNYSSFSLSPECHSPRYLGT